MTLALILVSMFALACVVMLIVQGYATARVLTKIVAMVIGSIAGPHTIETLTFATREDKLHIESAVARLLKLGKIRKYNDEYELVKDKAPWQL